MSSNMFELEDELSESLFEGDINMDVTEEDLTQFISSFDLDEPAPNNTSKPTEPNETNDNELPATNSAPRKPKRSRRYIPDLPNNLSHAFIILKHLISNSSKPTLMSYMEPVDTSDPAYKDYNDIIKNPIWINKIQSDLIEGKYETITEVVRDIRMALENAYRFHGANHIVTKRGFKLETMLNQKLALLPRDLKESVHISVTNPNLAYEEDLGDNIKYVKYDTDGDSKILSAILAETSEEGIKKRAIVLERRAPREDKDKEALEWEQELMTGEGHNMKAMWEIPQIGLYFFLAFKALNVPEMSQFALERILLIPQASTQLSHLMTTLVSPPQQRHLLAQKTALSYEVWNERVKFKVNNWFKLFHNNYDSVKILDQIGIDPLFFHVMNFTNPLANKDFHELTFHERVWIVKSLCDYSFHKQKIIQDTILNLSPENHAEYNLGHDRDKYEYLYFPQFCGDDLRIYKQHQTKEVNEYAYEGELLTTTPDPTQFYLVVDNLEALKELLKELESRPLVPAPPSKRKRNKTEVRDVDTVLIRLNWF